jgi:hypothetical protein
VHTVNVKLELFVVASGLLQAVAQGFGLSGQLKQAV